MSGQVKRNQVDWERASCLGLDTELFYDHRTGLAEKGLSLQHIRRICMSCPIQPECLTIGMAHEQYGFWGGLSDEERKFLHSNAPSKVIQNLKKDLTQLGLSWVKVFAHAKSIKRDFRYLNERKL